MMIAYLYLAVVRTFILHRDGSAARRVGVLIDRHHFSFILRGKHRLPICLDIDAFVYLLFVRVHRVSTHPERGSHQQELIPFHREGVVLRGSLALRNPCFHHHTVILVKAVHLDNPLQVGGIVPSGGIPGTFQTLRPALVVVSRQFEAIRIPLVLLQEAGMMLVGITHRSIAAKFFIRFVVSVQPVFAATLYPCRSRLDTEMVILFLCQSALSVGTFQYTLCQRHRSRNTVLAHLYHGKIRIPFCIFLILAHYYI